MTIYNRTEILIGKENLEKIKRSKVIVFGVGGVGGFAVEALCRAGIGHITAVDFDKVDVTNINRQIIALNSTVGRNKVDVLAERIKDINPNIKLDLIDEFIDEETIKNIEIDGFDYVIDAIDFVKGKIAIIEKSKMFHIPIISSMGMGNKLNPLDIKVGDIVKTKVCPLAKAIRKELRKREISNVKAVYSTEEVKVRSTPPGSISFVPSVAGLVIASEVIKDIIAK